jgi:spore maturation protein SpmB
VIPPLAAGTNPPHYDDPILLNLIWLGFFVSAFAVALGRLAMGDMEVFPKLLAVYFGSVGVKDTRHALGCALFADAVGIVAAIGVAYGFYR